MYVKELDTNQIKDLIFDAIWQPTYQTVKCTYKNNHTEEIVYRIYKT